VFIIAIGESKIESRNQSLASMPLSATSDVFVVNSNKMNSFAYDSSHSFSFECFASNNKNKEETPKELIKVIEDHENRTFIIKDAILIDLGTPDEPRELKI